MPSWTMVKRVGDDHEVAKMDMGLMNCGRVLDKKKFEKQLAKLKVENDKLCTEHNKLFEDVAKMFDWRDGRVDNMNYKKAVEEEFEKKKLEDKARLKVQMEKLNLAKEER
ncbi:hypothetical protein ZWY2020_047242 [Hordeum vulgare]|nr:hypothetical protein ZWY2020_047242 [Hordeum vulgare]